MRPQNKVYAHSCNEIVIPVLQLQKTTMSQTEEYKFNVPCVALLYCNKLFNKIYYFKKKENDGQFK